MLSIAGRMLRDKALHVENEDSRVYRWRDGMLEPLTEDQKDGNGYLLNCVGAGLAGTPVVRDISGDVAEDDVLVLCSDGIWGAVPDDEIEYYLAVSSNNDDIKEVYENGKRSVVFVKRINGD